MLPLPLQLLAKSELGGIFSFIVVVIWILLVLAKNMSKSVPKVPKPWEPGDSVPPPPPPLPKNRTASSQIPPLPQQQPKKKRRQNIPPAIQPAPISQSPFATADSTPLPSPDPLPTPLHSPTNYPPSRIHNLLQKKNLKSAILLSEVLQPPLTLRE